MTPQLFLSDNASPAHPAILDALASSGGGHYSSYGADFHTEKAARAVSELFDRDCGVYFVYNGTGANVSALRTVTRPYEAVICTEMAHINEDEAGAPEAIGGFKLLPVARDHGRLHREDLLRFLPRRGFVHTSQPATVSVTQSTEVGTVYWPHRLRELCDAAHEVGMSVHMDGARVANAAAAYREHAGSGETPVSPAQAMRAVTCDAGVDVLSFGATKNGILFGEAVVFFDRSREESFPFFRKQTTQLHSKMRYIAVQFDRYLADNLWYENASRANRVARRLAAGLETVPGVSLGFPVEANAVFPRMPENVLTGLQREFGFYVWDSSSYLARLMVSWDTREDLVDALVSRCRELAAS